MPSFRIASRNSRLSILPSQSTSNSRNVSTTRVSFLASTILSWPMTPAMPGATPGFCSREGAVVGLVGAVLWDDAGGDEKATKSLPP